MIVKVNWSGGKDSTCAVLCHLDMGHEVKAVCYIPMFTHTIPLIAKDHYEFIINTANELRRRGAEVHIISGMTYCEYVLHIAQRGKHKGKIFGFPYIACGQCGFKRDSKLKALNNLDIGYYDYEDIGIAYDEWSRKSQLTDRKRSILNELGITEEMAAKRCINEYMISPQYTRATRDGCVLCPNAKDQEIEQWLEDYPEAKPILMELQNTVKKLRPDRQPPRRGYKWFI